MRSVVIERLHQWIYRLTCLLYGRIRREHLASVTGAHNLPSSGPYILLPNHQSYMDNFLLAYVLQRLHGQRLYVPTNKKAFRPWLKGLWHTAVGGVEIDPDDPDQAYRTMAELLRQKRIIVIFPEGTRSDGTRLLPFKYGAFNVAAQASVPIVPAGLVGTAAVMPKGKIWPRKGLRASVAFGPPITPRAIEQEGVEKIRAHARSELERLALSSNSPARDPQQVSAAADYFASMAEQRIEDLLAKGAEQIRTRDLPPVFAALELAFANDPRHVNATVQFARAYGFKVMASPFAIGVFRLPRLRRLAQAALELDPNQPFTQYLLGQYHLRVPTILGGCRRAALRALESAYGQAAVYGIDRERFATAYATALNDNGSPGRAARLIEEHFADKPEPHCPRLRRRRQRAMALLGKCRSLMESSAEGESAAGPIVMPDQKRLP
jgi:1-acyl-sn-glycerol-3-phosphate acyltransferase